MAKSKSNGNSSKRTPDEKTGEERDELNQSAEEQAGNGTEQDAATEAQSQTEGTDDSADAAAVDDGDTDDANDDGDQIEDAVILDETVGDGLDASEPADNADISASGDDADASVSDPEAEGSNPHSGDDSIAAEAEDTDTSDLDADDVVTGGDGEETLAGDDGADADQDLDAVAEDAATETDSIDTAEADSIAASNTAADSEQMTESNVADADRDTVSPEPRSAPPPQPAPAPRPSVFPMLIAGVVTAGAGYFAAQQDLFGQNSDPYAGLPSSVASLSERVDVLAQSVEELASAEAPEVDLAPLSAAVEAVQSAAETLESRVAALEERPAQTVGGDTAADPPPMPDFSDEVDALRAQAEAQQAVFDALREQSAEQQSEIERLLEDARAAEEAAGTAAQSALARAAIGQVQAALDAGLPFDAALSELETLGFGDIPPELAAAAPDGVATLAALQSSIADAARDALAAARRDEGAAPGIAGFFAKHMGVRSTEPREGDDPDAILSRVENAARQNDLSTALSEAENLPEGAQAAMQNWLDQASARLNALDGVAQLLQRLPTN